MPYDPVFLMQAEQLPLGRFSSLFIIMNKLCLLLTFSILVHTFRIDLFLYDQASFFKIRIEMLQPDSNHIPLRVSGNDAIPGVPPLPITVGSPFHNLYGRGLIVAKNMPWSKCTIHQTISPIQCLLCKL
jgi:hypothetical protein